MGYVTESTILNMEKPQFKTIPCTKCQGDMPELRLTEYGYNFCIKCSESGKIHLLKMVRYLLWINLIQNNA